MRVKAAVLDKIGLPPPYAASRPLEIVDLDLAPPGRGEVLVRIKAAGLCHSDLSVIDGSRPRPTRWRSATRRRESSRRSARA